MVMCVLHKVMMTTYWYHCWQTVKLYGDEGIYGAMLWMHANSIVLKKGSFFINPNYIQSTLQNFYILFLTSLWYYMWGVCTWKSLCMLKTNKIYDSLNKEGARWRRSRKQHDTVKMVGMSQGNCTCGSLGMCGSFCCVHENRTLLFMTVK